MGRAGYAGPVRRRLPSWGSVSCDDQCLHASSAFSSPPLQVKEAQGEPGAAMPVFAGWRQGGGWQG